MMPEKQKRIEYMPENYVSNIDLHIIFHASPIKESLKFR